MKPHLLSNAIISNIVTVLEDVPKVEATTTEESPAVDETIHFAPFARPRHRSEEQDELPDEADA